MILTTANTLAILAFLITALSLWQIVRTPYRPTPTTDADFWAIGGILFGPCVAAMALVLYGMHLWDHFHP